MHPFIFTILLSSITLLITGFLILFPEEALSASLRGLGMWAEVVFPSLLPFFIVAELLMAFGVVKFLGVLFEPIMRPLFNVPGAGSFGWIMGMASGYPTGAKIAVRLREDKQLSQIEAERLVSFTNNSSPLFIFGAISIGFFHDQQLGLLLAVSHYVGNMMVGMLMRFHGVRIEPVKNHYKNKKLPSFREAFKKMHHTRMDDPRPFGEVLGDAVLQSIRTLIMVGGFIVLFSVIIRLLHLVDFSIIVSSIFEVLFKILSIPEELALPFFSGLFEITLGATLISEINEYGMLYPAIIVSFILGFNGFSIQAQVASILAKTDIRFTPYFFARMMHGIFASGLTVLLYQPLYVNNTAVTVFLPNFHEKTDIFSTQYFHFLSHFGIFITITAILVTCILLWSIKKRDGY